MQCFLTLGLPTFFYPAVYRGVENDTKAFTVASKTNNAGFYKYLSTLAIFYVLGVDTKCIALQYLKRSNTYYSLRQLIN